MHGANTITARLRVCLRDSFLEDLESNIDIELKGSVLCGSNGTEKQHEGKCKLFWHWEKFVRPKTPLGILTNVLGFQYHSPQLKRDLTPGEPFTSGQSSNNARHVM